eukprot:Protomagalhaensia_wolfi_Nauph_80__3257@NODE_3310_length_830_cov_1019_816688_g2596_i0_p1_GENE_NODE_3310_length_830_cov_1019_816688_g2596_i0NODE_3310_length_830_cov_1019_816688_g2596_i0_p1_ORF_typecomplete_len173_score31_35Thioredoxin/PF00085_20/3e29Thioredoxin_2/PF13098_6/2_1e06Thioredoxin_8/PF13905_6/0_0048Thioredoxin_8/PF13905_6/5_4Thioredoxin_3/PF13192_6/3_5e05AhpCTSA/PF00578_21/5_4e05Thioredoxin_9/PF14595_6/7_4e05Thioredoxin_7/PF13899_6/0_00017Thioredoxin_7/PF13899_6/9_2e03HyaE/PF07449_11/0_0
MKFVTKILSLLALSSVLYASAKSPIELTAANFDHDTQIGAGMTTGSWFIKFYAPWCGHCKRLAPTWEELVDELDDDPINVAKVDATVHKELAERFEIRGYPTLLFFKDDMMYKFSGQRDLDALASFARSGYSKAEGKPVPKALTLAGKLRKSINKMASHCSSPVQCLGWLSG